ncbi:response regulator [Paraburkholderia sp. 22099]|jgi:two-component system, chemotaxis family, chemotaxis protein CheY|uniref:CheY-like chemotaxis protein n=1 Tax=Paraburkholderia terricola TaxID=169427 RepID=A0A1M6UVM4_9BURK|nr:MULTISPECIES: response regulator [Paraburkholderia]ORC52078.1 response regulator [Burkholderia sp. A27]AXE95413.1 response regulator [Paraburkholderia terricola]MDR6411060.1 CheY-like chemotaxis protein [Paraburkholderia terricola]MDR6446954.1 CheY-like chemotaxis protein [Paraburkholderia terricola]MDR6483259.1 CheY-like chemotaxis protein [Paraburkholderia terricola]
MALPILVADDSALARKLLIKSLPDDWEVDITQASDGAAALESYRAGKGAVIFLDLTMPHMTGFEVLEAIQHEGLDAFVIVVSADIQSGAVERAKALGAIGFVCKPVSPEAIGAILREYGLHE